MTLLAPLFDRRSNLENPQVPLSSASIMEVLDAGYTNDAGVTVNETSALGLSGVWRSVNIIAGVGSSLPLKTYKVNTRERAVVRLLDNPHPDMTPKEFWEIVYVHLCLWGNSYNRIVRNDAGMIAWLLPIPPSCVKAGRVKDWQQAGMLSPKIYEVQKDAGGSEALTDYEVFHIPGIGYDGVCGASPIRIARSSLGAAMATEQYAGRLWGAGSLMAGILQSEQRLDEGQATALKERWRRTIAGVGKSHDIVVLGSGATFQPIQMPNDDAQFLESRRFSIDEQSRWFGIPPHLLFELTGSTSWGTGIEQQTIGMVKFGLHPNWLARVEARVTKRITPPSVYAEYALDGLLRGDSAARAAFLSQATGRPWMATNEARAYENLEPVEGGDDLWAPMNYAPAGQQDTTGGTDANQAA